MGDWPPADHHRVEVGGRQIRDAPRAVEQRGDGRRVQEPQADQVVRGVAARVARIAVEYSLTSLGESLNEPLAGLCRWVEKNGQRLERAEAQAE